MRDLDTSILISDILPASSPLIVGSRACRSVAPVQRPLRALSGLRSRASRVIPDHSSFCDVEGGPSSGLG